MSIIHTHTLTLPDGRTLAWREAGSGRPLILLHGWAMSAVVFSEMQAALAGDFRVLAPDLRGHGGSSPGSGYALTDFAADLDAWLTALDLDTIDLLGWSLGGEVAQLLAAQYPQRVTRLALISSTPRFASTHDWEHGLPDVQIKAMARDLRRNYELTMNGFFSLQFTDEALERERYRQIVAFAVRAGRLPLPEVALAALETLRSEDLRPLLPQLVQPTLVLHGGRDRIIPVAAGRYLGTTLPAARYIEWPDVGHAPFMSRPQDSVTLWREFFA